MPQSTNNITEMKLATGQKILLNLPIPSEIKNRTWRMVTMGRGSNCFVSTYIVETKQTIYLHSLLLPEIAGSKGYKLIFINNNRLDYRLENLAYESFKKYNTRIEKEEKELGKKTTPILTVPNLDNVVIRRSNNRSLECAACSTIDYEDHYRHCLGEACRNHWEGWIIRSGEWCKTITELIERARLYEE